MHFKFIRGLALLLALAVILTSCPQVLSANFGITYQLLNSLGGTVHYRLNVAISEALYQYYAGKDHMQISEADFAKFVTPYALKPIADCLREIYSDDEDFANGALMIVHQIPYEPSGPAKYPVETLADNTGDCDLLSFVAASIMVAGGLNVVLLYYESETHMNIGVNLLDAPADAREVAEYVEYGHERYYVAECTGTNWQDAWRVGECPSELEGASLRVISLEGFEQFSAGQVSASYETLEVSGLSLELSSLLVIQGDSVVISGQLSPTLQNRTVTIYVKTFDSPWSVLSTVTTDSRGEYSYSWPVAVYGVCDIRASWSGDSTKAPADSPTRTLTVIPFFLILLISVVVLLAVLGVIVFFASKSSREKVLEPKPPEIPS